MRIVAALPFSKKDAPVLGAFWGNLTPSRHIKTYPLKQWTNSSQFKTSRYHCITTTTYLLLLYNKWWWIINFTWDTSNRSFSWSIGKVTTKSFIATFYIPLLRLQRRKFPFWSSFVRPRHTKLSKMSRNSKDRGLVADHRGVRRPRRVLHNYGSEIAFVSLQ